MFREGNGKIFPHYFAVEVFEFVLLLIQVQQGLVQHLHVKAFLLAFLFISQQDLSGLWIIRPDLSQLDPGKFDHVQEGFLFKVLFPLSFVEGLGLNDILFVQKLISVNLIDHSGIELLWLPILPTDLIARMLNGKFEDGLVIVDSVGAWPFSGFIVDPFLFFYKLDFSENRLGFLLISFDTGLTFFFECFFEHIVEEGDFLVGWIGFEALFWVVNDFWVEGLNFNSFGHGLFVFFFLNIMEKVR
jgi:hypothetical protein